MFFSSFDYTYLSRGYFCKSRAESGCGPFIQS
uniref:Uncharacterized protein n=1 Tax=Anguilla anguilla TaxID=7936 RepID=A0A0E9QN07_ANGAN